jgi:hypothetical protein
MTTSTRLRASLFPLAAVLLLAACTGAAPGAPSASASPSPSTVPATIPPSVAPSIDPNASTGMDLPTTDPGTGVGGPGGARLVVPKPGQLDVRDIPAEKLAAVLDGRRVIVTVTYSSGVEPCYVLDSIVVKVGDKSFALTLREGHGPGDVMCIEMAETKQAQVDLGELAPGTYTITDATGGAPAIGVVVS